MTIVSAFLMPGNPLPLLKGDNPPWKLLADAARKAGAALRDSRPDVLLVYSTQWIAVLDELWQTRPHSVGRSNQRHHISIPVVGAEMRVRPNFHPQ